MIFNVSGSGAIAGSGSGFGLNFRVVGGTSEPSNVVENMIWVNTDTDITSWCLSHEEPEATEVGAVWIHISSNTQNDIEFNALKKNGIIIYPIGAFQWDGEKWVEKTTKVYQNGYWGDTWSGLIYLTGKYYADIDYKDYNSHGSISNGSSSINYAWADTEEGFYKYARRVFGAIDLTGFKTLTVTGGAPPMYATKMTVYITDVQGGSSSSALVKGSKNLADGGTGTVTLDISNLSTTNSLYIAIEHGSSTALGHRGTVTKIKLNR